MDRLKKSLLSAAALEGVAWIVGTTGAPVGLHVDLFIWMHFFPMLLARASRWFFSPITATITQLLFWTALVYSLYALFDRYKVAVGKR